MLVWEIPAQGEINQQDNEISKDMINSDKWQQKCEQGKVNSTIMQNNDNMPCHTHLTNLDLVWGYNKYICGIPWIPRQKASVGPTIN